MLVEQPPQAAYRDPPAPSLLPGTPAARYGRRTPPRKEPTMTHAPHFTTAGFFGALSD